jgi:polo-like kinase 1
MNPTNPASSSNRDLQKDPLPETQIIVEEKITNALGEVIIKKYARGKFLGKGGFAKCYEFTQLESKKLSAAKIIPKASLQKSRQRAKLLSEIKIHRSLNHTNIVKLEHVFEDSENVYIILELCTNQSLNELIKRRRRLMEIEVQTYILQLINGVKYLHGNRIIHRDLKLGNFF